MHKKETGSKERFSTRTGIISNLNNLGKKNNFKKIELEKINIISNIRKEYDKIDELAENIKIHGVQTPIKIIKNNDKYDLLFGHRRYLAAKKCFEDTKDKKFETIPAIIEDEKTKEEIIELQVIENLDREDLTDIEKAMAIEEYQKIANLNNTLTAKRFGKSEGWVRSILSAKNIVEGVAIVSQQNDSDENKVDLKDYSNISASVIAGLKNLGAMDQRIILDEIKDGNLTQSDVRKIKNKITSGIDVQEAIQDIKNKKESKITKSSKVEKNNINTNDIKIVISGKSYKLKERKVDIDCIASYIEGINEDSVDIEEFISNLLKSINTK